MKTSMIASLAMATLAMAQSLSDLPSCALPCLEDAVKGTSCSVDDFACICKDFDAIQGKAAGCILSACGQDTALNKVLPATKELCARVQSGGSSQAATSGAAPASTEAAAPTDCDTVSATATATAVPTEEPAPPVTAGAANLLPVGLLMAAAGALAL